MMGSNQDAPETYRGLLALEERGQQKIQYMVGEHPGLFHMDGMGGMFYHGKDGSRNLLNQ